MKGDAQVIDYLNKALKNELTTVNQYFLHARMLESWGLKKLAAVEYHESIDEMKHADVLIRRILFLEGSPQMDTLEKLHIGQDVKQMLAGDLKMEQYAHPLYKEAVAYCEACGDYVTRDLLAVILESEEGHIDWLETQLVLLDRIGLENYQQAQL